MKKSVLLLCAGIVVAAGFWFMSRQAFSQVQQAQAVLLKPELVKVPAGSFEMGSNDFYNAQPVNKVTLSSDFYIGKYEVTNQLYADVLNLALAKGYLDKDSLSAKAKRP